MNNRQFQIFPGFIYKCRYCHAVGFYGGYPVQGVDSILDLLFIGYIGCDLVQQQFFMYPLIYSGIGWQGERINHYFGTDYFFWIRHYRVSSGKITKKATTSKSLIPENSPAMAWVPPGEKRLAMALSSFLPITYPTTLAEKLCRCYVFGYAMIQTQSLC
jgi:hypothetical protein